MTDYLGSQTLYKKRCPTCPRCPDTAETASESRFSRDTFPTQTWTPLIEGVHLFMERCPVCKLLFMGLSANSGHLDTPDTLKMTMQELDNEPIHDALQSLPKAEHRVNSTNHYRDGFSLRLIRLIALIKPVECLQGTSGRIARRYCFFASGRPGISV